MAKFSVTKLDELKSNVLIGNDIVFLTQRVSEGTVDLGNGRDHLFLGKYTSSVSVVNVEMVTAVGGSQKVTLAAAWTGGTIDLGAGNNDQLILGNYVSTVTVSNVETIRGGTGEQKIILGKGNENVFCTGVESISTLAGNDFLMVEGINFTKVDGGDGSDTLSLRGKNTLTDFTKTQAFTNFEQIKLDGPGSKDYAINLDEESVLRISSQDQLYIYGDAKDSVRLSGVWDNQGVLTMLDNTSWRLLSRGETKVLVGKDVTVVTEVATLPTLFVADVPVEERFGEAEFTVSLSEATSQQVRVDYLVSDGTATSNSDYQTKSGTLTFAAWETSQSVTIPIVNDSEDEPVETAIFSLANAENAIIADSSATLNILDDDEPLSFLINNEGVLESGGLVTFTVHLSNVSKQATSVRYATSEGTATAGKDYTHTEGTLLFNAGETSKSITLSIGNDSKDEHDETINLLLSEPVGAVIGVSQGTLTIVDDDPSPGLTITAGSSVTEGKEGTLFTVELAAATDKSVTVDYQTVDGSAFGSSDYTASFGTLTFLPGETSRTLTVSLTDDSFLEPVEERFSMLLSNPVNATLVGSEATAIIVNNDQSPVDLAGLDWTTGVRFAGSAVGDNVASTISGVGDFNGDGFADFILGGYGANAGLAAESMRGESYVLFGKGGRFPPTVRPSSLDGQNGFILRGVEEDDQMGFAVAGVGDVNGDGLSDVVVGAPLAGEGNTGAGYLIFGHNTATAASMTVANLDGTSGVVIPGRVAMDSAGYAVAGAGDVNGDGLDDFVLGVPLADSTQVNESGEAYLIWGKTTGWSANLDLTAQNVAQGVRIVGEEGRLGRTVASAGDVNGDGYDDLLLAAPYADDEGSDEGEVYLLFGKQGDWSESFLVAQIDGANGVRIVGEDTNDRVGESLAGGGDVNGDGYGDFVIGAHAGDAAYLLFGGIANGWSPSISLANLDASRGVRIASHGAVAIVPDLNGDGYDDLLIGNSDIDRNGDDDAGASFVIFGKASSGWSADLNPQTMSATAGFRLNGASGDKSGSAVSGVGDFNGDGFGDLAIGAPAANSNQGTGYLFFGGDFSGEGVVGTGDATMNGSLQADRLLGGDGEDVLIAAGNGDFLAGGPGNDIIRIVDTGFLRIDGGIGSDTLAYQGSTLLNLTTLANGRIQNIETIDMTGYDVQSIQLTALDLIDFSSNSNRLLIMGDAGDALVVTDTGWVRSASNQSEDGISYAVYTHGVATLWVDSDIMPTLG